MSADRNPTFRNVLWVNGESPDHVGAHDKYEPVILSRVYFLLDREACQIKIGFTDHLEQRIRDLSRQRGRSLELLGTLRGGRHLERAMHDRFRPYRRERHEWYSSEIAAEVLTLLEPSSTRA